MFHSSLLQVGKEQNEKKTVYSDLQLTQLEEFFKTLVGSSLLLSTCHRCESHSVLQILNHMRLFCIEQVNVSEKSLRNAVFK